MLFLPPLLRRAARTLTARPGWLLAAVWLVVQVWSLRHGPVEVYDSVRYLRHAGLLAEGRGGEAPAHYQRYLGYALYLSGFVGAGVSLWAPVAGQVLLNGLATAAYYRTLRRLAGRAAPAGLATTIVLLWPDLQRYSAYILTESLFTSAVLLAMWALARAAYGAVPGAVSGAAPGLNAAGRWLLVGVALLVATLARPNGFLVPAAAAVAGLAWSWRALGPVGRGGLVLGGLGAAAALWPLLNVAAATYSLIGTYVRGDVIGGYPGWHIQPTAPLTLPPEGLPQLERIAAFAAAQPGYLGRLAAAKVAAFVLYIKPFWSTAHNIVAAAVLWPAWVLAARSLGRRAVPVGARWFAGALLAGQAAMVAVTIEDWDARFLTPLLPVVFGLAALELYRHGRGGTGTLLPPPPPRQAEQPHQQHR